MYNLTTVRRRYFDVKLKNGRLISVEPPKLKIMNQLVHTATSADRNDLSAVTEFIALFAKMLSKNKQGVRISAEQAQDLFDWDEMLGLLLAYFKWLNAERRDPN